MFSSSFSVFFFAFDILTHIENLIYKKTKTFSSCLFSFTKQNYHHHRHCSLYFFIIFAYLLLGLTNASNNTADVRKGFIEKLETYGENFWKNLNEGSNENSTTTNESSNATETSVFHKPKNMSDVRNILSTILRVIAQVFIIVSY